MSSTHWRVRPGWPQPLEAGQAQGVAGLPQQPRSVPAIP